MREFNASIAASCSLSPSSAEHEIIKDRTDQGFQKMEPGLAVSNPFTFQIRHFYYRGGAYKDWPEI